MPNAGRRETRASARRHILSDRGGLPNPPPCIPQPHPSWTPRLGRIRRRLHPSHWGILLALHDASALALRPSLPAGLAGNKKMPWLGRSQAEKSAQAVVGIRLARGGFVDSQRSAACRGSQRPDRSSRNRKCPGLGGPGGDPAQASMGIRLVRSLPCDACSEVHSSLSLVARASQKSNRRARWGRQCIALARDGRKSLGAKRFSHVLSHARTKRRFAAPATLPFCWADVSAYLGTCATHCRKAG
jgi:hypothetical protein